MTRFIKSSIPQEFGRLVNLDLVTSITFDTDHITFHHGKDHMTVWKYPDNETQKNLDWAFLESKLINTDLSLTTEMLDR